MVVQPGLEQRRLLMMPCAVTCGSSVKPIDMRAPSHLYNRHAMILNEFFPARFAYRSKMRLRKPMASSLVS